MQLRLIILLLIVIRSSFLVFDYYHKQFLHIGGNIDGLQKSEIAAQIFYPLLLRQAIIQRLRALIHELVYIGYDTQFTPNMISSLKKEIPKDKYQACREYNFDSIPNSKLYDIRSDHKKKSIDLYEDYIDDFVNYKGERVCRIWTFEKYKIIDNY